MSALELSVTRTIAAPPATVWQVMTDRMEDWWCPKPWRTEIIGNDFRPGGFNRFVMHGPAGERHESGGVWLEIVPGRRMVSTDAFGADWTPQTPFMVGFWEIAPEGDGTRYTARARHWSEEAHRQHQDMGFEAGWAAVADQLAELAEAEARKGPGQ